MNLEITTVHASREDFDFEVDEWDLVVLCFVDIICGGCIAIVLQAIPLAKKG